MRAYRRTQGWRRGVPLAGAVAMLAALAATDALADRPTSEQCEAARAAHLAEIERNRAHSIEQLEAQVAKAATREQRASLQAMIEQAWDQEESQIAFAHRVWRDCVAYAEAK